MPFPSAILALVERAFEVWRRRRDERRALRAIDLLGCHLRKDIGWPAARREPRPDRNPLL